jgi:hypothetical protein
MSDIEDQKKPPVFGVLSLVLPLVGAPLAYLIAKPTEAGWGWGGAMQLVVIISLVLLCGIVSAVIGLNRSEKYVGLSLLGLILNLLPIVLVLTKH